MKNLIESLYQEFLDELVSDGEIMENTDYVPYGDTYVRCCKTISDEDLERAKTRFVDYVKENIDVLFRDYDIERTAENKKMFIKLAKEL